MRERRVLVVGTTPDYIAYIDEHFPGRALFLTDTVQRVGAAEPAPGEADEIVCDLLEKEEVPDLLERHLEKYRQVLSGVACYDCEWLVLASELAARYGLPFPSAAAVRTARDKYRSKKAWAENKVRCPGVELVHDGWQALRLIERFGGPVVLKPLTGSGSELTFMCYDTYCLTSAFQAIKDGLAQRSDWPMYRLEAGRNFPVLAEEWVEGREYSADFMVENDRVRLIRVAKKLRDDSLPFGTTRAYEVPAKLPSGISENFLAGKLYEAARALGFNRAVCMADFMIVKNEPVFLELTPRTGGDCLPPLVRKSSGLDTVGLALDFAENKKIDIPPPGQWADHIGLRLFADSSGTLGEINCDGAAADARVKEIYLKRSPGHEIVVPPEDYDTWLLGHVIFAPEPDVNLKKQCDEILKKITIKMEQRHDRKTAGFIASGNRAVHPENPPA